MGWWPSKLIVILNIIILLGYNMISCVLTGQILSAVSSNGSMSVVVGEKTILYHHIYLLMVARHHHCGYCDFGSIDIWYQDLPYL